MKLIYILSIIFLAGNTLYSQDYSFRNLEIGFGMSYNMSLSKDKSNTQGNYSYKNKVILSPTYKIGYSKLTESKLFYSAYISLQQFNNKIEFSSIFDSTDINYKVFAKTSIKKFSTGLALGMLLVDAKRLMVIPSIGIDYFPNITYNNSSYGSVSDEKHIVYISMRDKNLKKYAVIPFINCSLLFKLNKKILISLNLKYNQGLTDIFRMEKTFINNGKTYNIESYNKGSMTNIYLSAHYKFNK